MTDLEMMNINCFFFHPFPVEELWDIGLSLQVTQKETILNLALS